MADVFVRVAGLSYPNSDGTSRIDVCSSMKKGRKLLLVDSSSVEHPESISVLNVQKQMLGFIPKSDAEYIRSVISDFSEIEASLYDSWTIRGSENPFVEIRLRHIKLHKNVIGRFCPLVDDWERLRDVLGIDYDQKITHNDVEHYQLILSGRADPPVLSHPRKRKPDPVVEYVPDPSDDSANPSSRVGCLTMLIFFVSLFLAFMFIALF